MADMNIASMQAMRINGRWATGAGERLFVIGDSGLLFLTEYTVVPYQNHPIVLRSQKGIITRKSDIVTRLNERK
ncbi:hypothetical protein [Serratia oryzae]|uniref:hypothetical protein n=1 Tax=Serratia oryzae TaxID=2034155 RepID=UPI0018CF625E|nr:hypothetical protein [Serratia oryzae]